MIQNTPIMDLNRIYFRGIVVPVNVSVKNVPDEIMEKLRQRAKKHHRSVQGELKVILEEATSPDKLSLDQAESRLKMLGLETGDDSASWIRELRNAR
jgi:plasmid stability protein